MGKAIDRDYGFLFSVGAEQEVAARCPGGEISRLRDMIGAGGSAKIDFTVDLICILSRWHEKARAFELGTGYEERPLTREEILLLPLPAFKALQTEALAAMLRDQQQTVEAEPEKKSAAPKLS